MALVEGTGGRRSLEEVHGSVGVPAQSGNPFKRLFAFLGPAYLVSVGYMDPGNWATDLEGGARFGYTLVWVLLMSNVMAVLLQTLAARLGVVTGHDLAQACRAEYSRRVNAVLWVMAEVAIAATDLAEVLGTIIALKLLFGIPLLWGCLVTAFDTFLLLYLQRWGMRATEAVILALVATIGGCFLIQIFMARPDAGAVLMGLRPRLPEGSLYVAIGILGATVMPHNLYLHSALVQSRRIGPDAASKRTACRFNLIDSAVALNAAFFVNAAILILSAAVFHRNEVAVASIEEAYRLLPSFLGRTAPILFGVALLCAGQSSTLTGTLAGQIVMEGYLHLRIAPWLRRLVTRSLALIPAVVVIALTGEGSTQKLLVLSQVVLSLQLSFAVIPLIHFTSNRKNMGAFATPWWGQILAWLTAAVIVGLNGKLVFDKVDEWVRAAAASGRVVGSVPLSWWVGGGLYGLAAAVMALLAWVTLKPWLFPTPAWTPAPSVQLDWVEALRPRPLETIGVALEHNQADAEILNRALSLATPGQTKLVLLHVVDTPMTRVYGDDTDDRETGADRRYLAEVTAALTGLGYETHPALLHGADRAGQIVGHVRRHPVDLLVVGSHGHGLVRDLLLGQTVDKVRHGLDVPMLIARPDRAGAAADHARAATAPPAADPVAAAGPGSAASDGHPGGARAGRVDRRGKGGLQWSRKPRGVSARTGSGRQDAMAITYYKRFRMEIDLDGAITPPGLPAPFAWVAWDEALLDRHAEVKYLSFRDEIDASVFPCLGDRYGCQRLMREIRRKPGFLAGATWMIACPGGFAGTVQGVMDRGPIGAIQNLGVLPAYRGVGLGDALVRQALEGFYQAGLRRAYLEVTAENSGAVRLYRAVGFRRAKTLYKAVDG